MIDKKYGVLYIVQEPGWFYLFYLSRSLRIISVAGITEESEY